MSPLNSPPVRAAPLPGGGDPTGELGDVPDALADSEQTPAPPAGRAAKIEFIGSAGEYARIWYVNRILSLLTLGIYSAWAKVRQRQYLASHTLIDGVPLVYEGRPLPILYGRLLAFAILGVAWGLQTLFPWARPAVVIVMILAAPWFVLSTLAFNARNHSWRGLHFHFTGSFRQAAKAVYPLLVWPASALAFWALGQLGTNRLSEVWEYWVPLLIYALLFPWTAAAIVCLKFDGLRLGDARVTLGAKPRDINALHYRVGGRRFMKLLLGGVVVCGLIAPRLGPEFGGAMTTVVLLIYVALASGYVGARGFNLILHRLCLADRLRFRSALSLETHARLFLRNALLTVATLGLAAPWCQIKVREARLQAVTIYVDGSLDEFFKSPTRNESAVGESLSEGLGLDLSL
ncbi:MAG: DUF898 domain-containing protein [Betaproteobacteria bacterium]|nr:DUF898 domain-containing protein [Betaproteobacteria bacterium]